MKSRITAVRLAGAARADAFVVLAGGALIAWAAFTIEPAAGRAVAGLLLVLAGSERWWRWLGGER